MNNADLSEKFIKHYILLEIREIIPSSNPCKMNKRQGSGQVKKHVPIAKKETKPFEVSISVVISHAEILFRAPKI